MTVLEPGSHLGLLQEAKSIHPATAADSATQYKLDYQFVSEETYYFAYSDEFTVQGAGMNCKQARQIALAQAQSSPDWHNIDTARAVVRWQDENQTCRVDFAWHGAAEIRTGLWSEGYYVVVSPRFGQVIEANAYER